MPKNTSMSLGDHFAAFVDQQVQAGRYGSASEVVRAGLRLLEEREAKVVALREAIEAGEKSGIATGFNKGDFLARMHREHGQ